MLEICILDVYGTDAPTKEAGSGGSFVGSQLSFLNNRSGIWSAWEILRPTAFQARHLRCTADILSQTVLAWPLPYLRTFRLQLLELHRETLVHLSVDQLNTQ